MIPRSMIPRPVTTFLRNLRHEQIAPVWDEVQHVGEAVRSRVQQTLVVYSPNSMSPRKQRLVEVLCEEPNHTLAQMNQRPAVEPRSGIATAAEERIRTLKTALDAKFALLDEQYQMWVCAYFDPIFGRDRSEMMESLSSGGTVLQLSDYEKMINRKIAYSTFWLGIASALALLYPPALYLFVVPMVYVNLHVYTRAYASLRQGKFDYYCLMPFPFTGMMLGGYIVAGMFSALVYNITEKLLAVTQDRSYRGLANIFGQQLNSVWLLTPDGTEVEIPFEQVQAGDVVVVGAGQMAPVDGTVLYGMATVDQHMLTGEAQPVEKGVGDTIYAATIILAGKVHLQVEKAGETTMAAQIGNVLNNTSSFQMSASIKSVEIAHRTALPVVLTGGVASLLLGLQQGIAVVSSGIGTNVRPTAPIAMLNFLNIASRKGILIKDARSLELLDSVDTILFDKTGTLTLEQPEVCAIHLCGTVSEADLLRYAAAAEQRQPHPIAKAIVEAAQQADLVLPTIDEARYEVGYGIKVILEKALVCVGSERFMSVEGIALPEAIRTQQDVSHAQGHSMVMVAIDQQLVGAIELRPTLRPEAQQVVQALHQRGLSLAIISGDQEAPTANLANTLGIDRYFANTLPENKAALVEQLQQEGHAVCFVGDGINDAIALKKANVSVSLRGATTVATDTAQVVLVDHGLQQLVELFTLADKFNANMRSNLTAAIVPGLINIAGVFVLHWGIYTAILLTQLGLVNNVRIAMQPLFHEHKEDRSKLPSVDKSQLESKVDLSAPSDDESQS